MRDRLSTLTEINLDDLVAAFGLRTRPALSWLLRRLFRRPAEQFAQRMLDFDAAIGERGLPEAARRAESTFVNGLQVLGAENLPAGALLAVANHPGMTDTLALLAALNRPDLKAIALNRPFLLTLRNLSRHMLYLPEEPADRTGLIRSAANHLRQGGALLTFPAGRNEPDPDVYPGAVEALGGWLDSASLFLRLAPETVVVPVCVRGVSWIFAARHPLLRLRKTQDDRQLLASAIQLLYQFILHARPVSPRVEFGRPISPTMNATTRGQLHGTILSEMERLIDHPQMSTGQRLM